MSSKRTLVTQRVVTVDILIPQLYRFLSADRLHLDRCNLSHRPHDLALRRGFRPQRDRLSLYVASPPRWQLLHQSAGLEFDQGFRTGIQLVPPRWRDPVQMFTDRPDQFLPAQSAKHPNRFLEVLDFLRGELAPGKEVWRSAWFQSAAACLRSSPQYHLKIVFGCPALFCEKINLEAGLTRSDLKGNWSVRHVRQL